LGHSFFFGLSYIELWQNIYSLALLYAKQMCALLGTYQSKVAKYQKLAPDAFYIFYSFDGAFKRKHGAT
jgi:hypothetical protein